MKLFIAFAAVLSSAALTVPTVTDVGDSDRAAAARIAASSDADAKNENA